MPAHDGPSSSYGAVGDTAGRRPSYTNQDDAGRKEAAWEWRGNPWWLMFEVVKLYGRQLLMLITIVTAVFTSKEFLMICDSRVTGLFTAGVCEYSKAYVRCFPLLALVVSLLSACRVFLFLRVFYQMLKRGILIQFDNFPPYKDPLFQLLCFCMSQAVLHFILNICTAWGIQANLNVKDKQSVIKADEFQESVNQLAVFYIVPTILFFALFYSAYDISELVLPFCKYFEDDPQSALHDVKNLTVISELEAMITVQADVLAGVGYCNMDTYCARFAERAEHEDVQKSPMQLSEWRLSSAWWPARVLLDFRITGSDGTQFKRAWWAFIVPVVVITGFVAWFCCLLVRDKALDVASGQREDMAGLIVGVLMAALIVKLGAEFFIKVMVKPLAGFGFKKNLLKLHSEKKKVEDC